MLGSLVALGGIVSVGTVGFLNKTNEEQKVEPTVPIEKPEEIKNEIPEPKIELEASQQETPAVENIEPRQTEPEVTFEEKTQEVTESQSKEEKDGETVRGGRVYSKADLEAMAKRDSKDAAFADKTGELSWSGGGDKLNTEKQQEIKNKFTSSNFLKKLGYKRKLIDYTDDEGWRLKTSIYMRSDEYSPKELHSAIDDDSIDTDDDEWKEQYAWRLREICYKTAEEVDKEEKIKEAFSIVESTDTELSMVNLCTFEETETE